MPRNRRAAQKHGYLVIDKPGGWTSHDVVSRVRRIIGERRVGHAGTLDPAAVGVLPIAVGLATRTVEYLSESTKAYRADVTFGMETDSADGDGAITSQNGAEGLNEESISAALSGFSGPQFQRPPMHSAVKVDGRRLYELARAGDEIDVAPRAIEVLHISCVAWNSPIATIDIVCSKGTYVRSIARDLGHVVGTGAFLSNLVRTATGPFTLADAVTLDELADLVTIMKWEDLAHHSDRVIQHLPAAVFGAEDRVAWIQGKTIPVSAPDGPIRVYDSSGTWIGVGTASQAAGIVQPDKVITI